MSDGRFMRAPARLIMRSCGGAVYGVSWPGDGELSGEVCSWCGLRHALLFKAG